MWVTCWSVSISSWQARLMRTRLTKSVKVLPVALRKKRLKRLSLMPSSAASALAECSSARWSVMRLTTSWIWSIEASSSSLCSCTLESSR